MKGIKRGDIVDCICDVVTRKAIIHPWRARIRSLWIYYIYYNSKDFPFVIFGGALCASARALSDLKKPLLCRVRGGAVPVADGLLVVASCCVHMRGLIVVADGENTRSVFISVGYLCIATARKTPPKAMCFVTFVL